MQTNTVDVDDSSIDAGLDQLSNANGHAQPLNDPPPLDAQPEMQAQSMAIDWTQALGGAMQLFAKVIAPNWKLSDDEINLIVNEGGKTLDAFFPNLVLEGKWLALFSFSMVTGGIMLQRFDLETMQFKALRVIILPDKSQPANNEPLNVTPINGKPRVVATPWVGGGL